MSTQAELLSISRSSLYYKPIPPALRMVAIRHRIDEIYTQKHGDRVLVSVFNADILQNIIPVPVFLTISEVYEVLEK